MSQRAAAGSGSGPVRHDLPRGARGRSAARIPGFPTIGRTIPAAAVTAVGVLAALVAAWLVIGVSGWLVVALLLIVAGAGFPRGPFAALLIIQLAVAQVLVGVPGYTGTFALLLVMAHLAYSTGALSAWLPRRGQVQVAVLRRPLVRFAAVQVATQIVAFVVLALVRRPSDTSLLWLGLVGAGAALVLAVVFVVPALLRPSAD